MDEISNKNLPEKPIMIRTKLKKLKLYPKPKYTLSEDEIKIPLIIVLKSNEPLKNKKGKININKPIINKSTASL